MSTRIYESASQDAPRFARYRSVRKRDSGSPIAAADSFPAPPSAAVDLDSQGADSGAGLFRSRSRYRKPTMDAATQTPSSPRSTVVHALHKPVVHSVHKLGSSDPSSSQPSTNESSNKLSRYRQQATEQKALDRQTSERQAAEQKLSQKQAQTGRGTEAGKQPSSRPGWERQASEPQIFTEEAKQTRPPPRKSSLGPPKALSLDLATLEPMPHISSLGYEPRAEPRAAPELESEHQRQAQERLRAKRELEEAQALKREAANRRQAQLQAQRERKRREKELAEQEAALAEERSGQEKEERERKEKEAIAQRHREEREAAIKRQKEDRERLEREKAEKKAAAKREREEREQAEIALRMREKQKNLEARAARHQSMDKLKEEQRASQGNPIDPKAPRGMLGLRKRGFSDPANVALQTVQQAPQQAAQPQNAAGIDAPISSVNAGERRVVVQCQTSSILLPVTPTTTPLDLIRSAANCFSVPIDPKASVLMESFGKVGVQRPLRNYERVRDVLNSWDDDRQNVLTVLPSATGGNDVDLDASSVLKDEPLEFNCTMHYSQKPGKWDKKRVTLRSDGQVMISKKEDARASETTNICHISDFDIYTPSEKHLTKKIRPPKRLCFAVKSQQKSAMFESLENFVHFFCTNDKNLAASFYRAMQGWRSWYLVNKLGAGEKTRDRAAATVTHDPETPVSNETSPVISDMTRDSTIDDSTDVSTKKSSMEPAPPLMSTIPPAQSYRLTLSASHKKAESKDSFYQIGSFKPLLNFDDFSTQTPQIPQTTIHEAGPPMPSLDPKVNARAAAAIDTGNLPPAAVGRYKAGGPAGDRKMSDARQSEEKTFSPGGLLGQTYLERQKAVEAREASAQKESPFTTATGLIRKASTTTAQPQPASFDSLKRTSSRRLTTKPLLDFTPTPLDVPPHQQKKGRAFVPDRIGRGGLIESATTPETAPDTRTGRASTRPPPTPRHPPRSASLSRTRSRSRPRRGTTAGGGDKRADDAHDDMPAASGGAGGGSTWPLNEGLLAGVGRSQGAAGGRGVKTGTEAAAQGRTLLGRGTDSAFTAGSLLQQVERREGPRAPPVLDRSKGREVSVGTGEGL